MAARFLVGGGDGNWNSTNNWSASSGGGSGASFPINGDTVTLDTASGATNITVNVASACTSIVASGTYTGTVTFNNTLTSAGTVTFIAGMSIAGTSDLICNTTATLTSGGKTLTGGLQLKGTSQVYTLGDNWTINGTLTLSGTTAITITSNTINVGGSLTETTATSGTANIVMNGTGTWSGANFLGNNLTFNTAGTITISGSVGTGGTFTFTSGTVISTGSTWTNTGATFTINNSGFNVNNFRTISNLNINGTNGFTINGNLTVDPVRTLTLLAGNTYTIASTGKLTAIGTLASAVSIVSSSGVTQAILTLSQGATQDVSFVTATRIDSSLGQTIWDYKGTLTTATNWKTFPQTFTLGYGMTQ